MKNKFLLFAALAVAVLLIAACAPAAQPTAAPPTSVATSAPAPTSAPQATSAPTSAPQATTAATEAATSAATTAATTAATAGPTSESFVGDKTVAPNCNYGTDALPAEIKSIEATDEYTVKISLCHPDPDFPQKIAFSAFGILPKAYLTSIGGDSTKVGDNPVTSGPYKVQEWVHGDHITFTANPDYWGGAPKTKTVILKWSSEAAQRLLELQSGQADGIDNVAPEDIATVQGDTTLKLYPREPLTIAFLGFNNNFKPLDNEKVRQALAMAIDRKRIVDNFCAPGSLVAEEYIPPSIKPGADDLKWYTYDKDAAKKALADAGFPNGFDMELSYRDVVRPYLPSPSKVAQDLQAQLKEIGVNVKLNVMESGAFLDAADAGNLPMFLLGWFADFAGPTNFYDTHFSAGIKDFGKSFDDITTEMNAAAKLSDPAERQMHYSKINQLLKQHVPLIPIMHCNSSVAFKANVQGAHSSPFGDEEFAQMSNGTDQLVFVQNAEPIALWCADEDDGETFRACVQLYDPLLKFSIGGTDIVPGIAEKYSANPDATEWTFNLRQNAKFSDGSELNANDVVATLTAIWDAKNPNHKGRTGNWNYMQTYFGHCLNAQPTTCTP